MRYAVIQGDRYTFVSPLLAAKLNADSTASGWHIWRLIGGSSAEHNPQA